jgi:molecular chaperone DnaJ
VREIEVTVPAGIESGAAQTLVGAGSRVLAGHPAGDLEIVIQLEDHPSFRRDGDDVRSDLELPYVVAALGGEVDVLTLHGVRRLRVPEGTATDSELRLRGLGVPHRFRSGSGDHIARAKLRIPERLSQRARELIAEFDAVAGIYEDTSIIGKIRSFFSG